MKSSGWPRPGKSCSLPVNCRRTRWKTTNLLAAPCALPRRVLGGELGFWPAGLSHCGRNLATRTVCIHQAAACRTAFDTPSVRISMSHTLPGADDALQRDRLSSSCARPRRSASTSSNAIFDNSCVAEAKHHSCPQRQGTAAMTPQTTPRCFSAVYSTALG
jgi:hypothetical protein